MFPFPALAGTDYRQAEVPKQRKMGAKIKSFIPKVTSINIHIKKKSCDSLGLKKRKNQEEQLFLKIKTMRRPLSRFKLKKTPDLVVSV